MNDQERIRLLNKALDRLLLTHIAAWQSDTKASGFVERVNETYAAYLANGGNDEHYLARWHPLRHIFARRARTAALLERTGMR